MYKIWIQYTNISKSYGTGTILMLKKSRTVQLSQWLYRSLKCAIAEKIKSHAIPELIPH